MYRIGHFSFTFRQLPNFIHIEGLRSAENRYCNSIFCSFVSTIIIYQYFHNIFLLMNDWGPSRSVQRHWLHWSRHKGYCYFIVINVNFPVITDAYLMLILIGDSISQKATEMILHRVDRSSYLLTFCSRDSSQFIQDIIMYNLKTLCILPRVVPTPFYSSKWCQIAFSVFLLM